MAPPAAAANAMTKITLSFLLSLLGDKNFQGPDAPVNSKYHWAYKGPEGPESWHVHYKYCAGERQSPINIVASTCEYDPGLEPIVLEHVSGPAAPCLLNVTNNGHAASVRVVNRDLRVRGGGLADVYKTVEFHFHWGSTDEVGSEHAINGRKYPLEMHLVSYAEKYGNVKEAMTKPGGLAVLGVFFEISEKDNPVFSTLDDALRHIHKAGDHTTINQLRLRSLLPDDLSQYWRYNGSLTTPFCFESVIWTIFKEPQKISKSQLETLRSLLHEEGHDISDRGEHRTYTPSRLLDNWRPLQPLNGRVVKQSFRGDFVRNKPILDTKLTSFQAAAQTSAISGSPESLVKTVVYNINPTFQPTTGQEVPKEKALPQDRNKITETNNFNSQQSFGRGPMEEKLLLYNPGPAGVVDINSSPVSHGSEKSQPSDATGHIGLAEEAATTLFGQIQQSSQGMSVNVGPEANEPRQGTAGGHTSSGSTPKAPDQQKDTRGTEKNGQLSSSVVNEASTFGQVSSSGANDVARNVQGVQNSNSGRVTMVISTSTSTPSPRRFHVSSPPTQIQRLRAQPSVQALSISPPMKAQSLAVAGNSQLLTPRQLSQTPPNTNHQQKHAASSVSNSSPRTGQIDSRIAELANNIRSHRHQEWALPYQPNNNLHMPPVIRHNMQTPVANQNQHGDLNSQRQRNFLQQQRQQILQMRRPPTSQELRAIFQKLAASNRANASRRTITSGAAAIPRAKIRNMNSVSGTRFVNAQPSATHPTQNMAISREYNSQFLSPASSTSLQSSRTNQNTNLDYTNRATSSYLPPLTYWSQPYQQQMHSQHRGYQQRVAQQLPTQPQQSYQSPTQQQYIPPAPAMYSPVTNADNTNLYFAAGHGAPGSSPNIMSAPQGSPVDSNAQQVYYSNQQQPVRILRPVYEQVANWQPTQYQNQQYPFFVY
ncbi:hypothetical protein BsWGS_07498 [Bradybaena similaris]